MKRLHAGTVVTALLIVAAGASAAAADQCTNKKLKAIGRKEQRLLNCQATVAATNDASRLAAFANGAAGDLAFKEKSYGLTAVDVADNLGRVLAKFL